MNKTSFRINIESLNVLDLLTDEQAGQLIKAIYSYHTDDGFDYNDLSDVVRIAFVPFKTQFERDAEKSISGENHWNWKGGVSSENAILRNSARYKDWREFVFDRDDYTCQECGLTGGELNAHHIEHWSKCEEKRFDVDNGITLCRTCHIKVHSSDSDSKKDNDNKAKDITSLSPKADPIPYQKIIDLYHQTLPDLPRVAKLTPKRKGQIRQRFTEDMKALDNWENFFDHVKQSDFLMGRIQPINGRSVFRADIEWLTNQTNFTKIAEGKYHV